VNTNTMRKLFALSMVALLALTLAIAALGCGKKAEEAPAATETPAAGTMTDSTAAGSMDSTATMADSTAH
jgi:hypothetical protein